MMRINNRLIELISFNFLNWFFTCSETFFAKDLSSKPKKSSLMGLYSSSKAAKISL